LLVDGAKVYNVTWATYAQQFVTKRESRWDVLVICVAVCVDGAWTKHNKHKQTEIRELFHEVPCPAANYLRLDNAIISRLRQGASTNRCA